MKKICIVVTTSMSLEIFIVKMAEYLFKMGNYDITLICDNGRKFQQELPPELHFIPVQMKRGIDFRGIKAIWSLYKVFRSEKFDFVQYTTPNASFYASIAAKMARIPIRLYCQWGMVYVGFSGVKRFFLKLIEKLICSLSTTIETDSRSNLNFAHNEKLYPIEKGSVIWNGSACGLDFVKFDITKKSYFRSVTRKKMNIPNEAFVFGFVGRVTRDKGINELFYAMQRIEKITDDTYLLLVGIEEKVEEIDQELYRWAKKNDRVIFSGYTNNVEQFLSAMDCYILPSYREGFGMGVIEAEALGIPVIVTDIPGPIDAMIDNQTGIVVAKNDLKQNLLNAMSMLYSNKQMRIMYGRAGYSFVSSRFEQNELFRRILETRNALFGGYRL